MYAKQGAVALPSQGRSPPLKMTAKMKREGGFHHESNGKQRRRFRCAGRTLARCKPFSAAFLRVCQRGFANEQAKSHLAREAEDGSRVRKKKKKSWVCLVAWMSLAAS